MKTLLITDTFPPKTGGSGRWFRELYGRLPASDYLIAAGEASGQDEYDRINPLNLRRLPLAIRYRGIRGLSSFREYSHPFGHLLKLVKSQRIGMIHCARCLPEGILGLGLRLFAKAPFACYAHGEELNTASTSREQTFWARLVLSRARFVIANSQNTAHILRSEWGMPEGRIRVLHPGVDIVRFAPSLRDPVAREDLGWGDRRVILTVGRLQKRKGHDRMILALETIRRTYPDVLYSILGAGEELATLERLVADNDLTGHVQFLGELDDQQLVRCYQQCDLFVLPNREINRDIEGFGMVLIEAQACGKPVIAGTSGGTAETMLIGRTGHVVPCDHPEELAALISKLLTSEDQRLQMGEEARRWVVEEFDWSVLASRARELFERTPTERHTL